MGLNPLPPGRKTCTFDCVYCQYGRSRATAAGAGPFPSVDETARALDAALQETTVDFITFSGNGEPTLHPCFRDIVKAADEVRRRRAPAARLAILSNSTTVTDPLVREGLALLDLKIMKLDAGLQGVFEAVNGPAPGITVQEVITALAEIEGCVLQSCFIKGEYDNCGEEAVRAYLGALAVIKPRAVQVYTADRPCADPGVLKASGEVLRGLARRIGAATGIAAAAF